MVCVWPTLADADATAKNDRIFQEGDEEVRELLQTIKVMAGLSTDDPPDTQWIKMEKMDRKTGRKVKRIKKNECGVFFSDYIISGQFWL